MTESVIRVDTAPMPRVTRTDEGYLRGEAIVTRTGVFRYRNADGTERRELRHPDDVLRDDSVQSMRQIPITVDHPGELVTADTASTLSVGMTGENVRDDGSNIIAPFTITHKAGIDAVNGGRRELSLGYRLDLVEEQGEYNGERYDYRQTNVKYNHLAVVSQARAGSTARINLDGASVLIATSDGKETPMTDKTPNMVAVNLDGISYDAAPEIAKAYDKATARADAAEVAQADITKERDTLQARADELEAEVKGLKEVNHDEAIADAAKARVSLLTKAGKVIDADEHMDATERDIMIAVIAKRHDGVDLAERSDDYVTARFDAVIEAVEADGKGIKKQAEKVGSRTDASEPKRDARADMADGVLNMWKSKTEGAA